MSQLEKCDRRSLRSQRALRQALASELAESGDLSRINVASLTERAGLTRRTFYSHYRDIPDFINQIEDGLLAEIRERIELITAAQLPDLYHNIDELEPAPGSVELLRYLAANRDLIGRCWARAATQALLKRSSTPRVRLWCRAHRRAFWAWRWARSLTTTSPTS